MKKRQTRAVLVGGLIAAALIPAGAANAAPKANPAVGFGCPKFTVVVTDVEAGFPRGTYNRLNFAPTEAQLSCDYSFHVFRSYLYHPDTHRGWSVQKLRGALKNRTGKRFLKNGTGGLIGFDVYK